MQLNHDRIKRLESEWLNTEHPEERRAIYSEAAQHCQDCGFRLLKEGNGWRAFKS